MHRFWSNKEVEMLSDATITDEQIAKKTGRTLKAIESKRRAIDKGYFPVPVEDEPFLYNPYKNLTKSEKIKRIHDLADRLEVKIVR